MRAYEAGDLARGDELMHEARSRKTGNEGTGLLLTHLAVWRRDNAVNPGEFTQSVLRWPLIHPGENPPFRFLADVKAPVALEGAPADH
jgi:hypothetical protein